MLYKLLKREFPVFKKLFFYGTAITKKANDQQPSHNSGQNYKFDLNYGGIFFFGDSRPTQKNFIIFY